MFSPQLPFAAQDVGLRPDSGSSQEPRLRDLPFAVCNCVQRRKIERVVA